MISEHSPGAKHGFARRLAGAVVRFSFSLKLTVVLLAHLAVALAWGAYLERTHGLEYAQWHVYHSRLLVALLIALAVNAAGGALVRLPRRWGESGAAAALVGLTVLFAGFIQSWYQGIEGRLVLWQGETAQTALVPHRSQITLLSPLGSGVQATELGFSPGPADWRSDEPLEFGEVDGMSVRVLNFYRHARHEAGWAADESGAGKPVIQVALSDAQGGRSSTRWYVPILFGTRSAPGEPYISLEQASVPSLRDDFLKPPALKPGGRGVVSMHHKDRVYQVPVDGNTEKPVPVGDSGLTVEIAYYANAKSTEGKFSSEGTEPKNPMLQLKVHVPGQQQPITEIAYANKPFVNYEAIKKRECPVKFWYHHPGVPAISGAEFLQTPDGQLYCRVGSGGVYQPRGEVKEGDAMALSDGRQVTLVRYIPHARPETRFVPVESAPGETTEAEAAALIELTIAEKTEQFWLGRNDARLGVREMKKPGGGPLIVTFGYERRPLPFSVKLVEFQRIADPDLPSDVSCVSQVQLTEPTQDSDVVSADNPLREIATGRPLEYGAFRFYQSGFREMPGFMFLSMLRVTSDPGWLLKWSGAAVFCVGVLLTLFQRILAARAGRGVTPALSSPS